MIQSKTSYVGQRNVSTLAGEIKLEEGRGRLVIYDPITKKERQVHDIQGSHYKDVQGRTMTSLGPIGLTTMEPDTGRYRNRVGLAGDDGRTGIWTSQPGTDVREIIG